MFVVERQGYTVDMISLHTPIKIAGFCEVNLTKINHVILTLMVEKIPTT